MYFVDRSLSLTRVLPRERSRMYREAVYTLLWLVCSHVLQFLPTSRASYLLNICNPGRVVRSFVLSFVSSMYLLYIYFVYVWLSKPFVMLTAVDACIQHD